MIWGMGGIYQREGNWYYRTRVNGRLHRESLAQYGIKTEAQARAYMREMEKAKLENRLAMLDPSRVSLVKLAAQFLEERAPYLAKNSLDRYRVSLKALAADFGQDCLVRTITARKLGQWAQLRLKQGVSPAGVNTDLRHIKAVLRRAEKWGVLEKAPDVEMIKEPRRLPRHLSAKQIDILLNAEGNPERKRLWVFMLWTGCRRSEALGLRWENLTWGDKPAARVVGKGDRERVVPLLPPVVAALGEPKDIGPVFPLVYLDTATKWWQKLVRSQGMAGIRLHDLRHTAATYMISKGVPVGVVRQIMGHSDIRTTMGYAKALVADLYDEMSKLLD